MRIDAFLLMFIAQTAVGDQPRLGLSPTCLRLCANRILWLPLLLMGIGSTANTAHAQQIDCAGFATFVHSTLGDHLEDEEFFKRYFGRSLQTQSQEQLEGLVKWARDCEDYIHNNVVSLGSRGRIVDSHYWFDLSPWIDQGIGRLEQMVDARKQEAEDREFKKNLAVANTRNEALIADIPSCNDEATVSSLKSYVKHTSEGHEILGLKDFSDVSNPLKMGWRVCQVDALFDVGEHQLEFGVKWFDKSEGQLSITVY